MPSEATRQEEGVPRNRQTKESETVLLPQLVILQKHQLTQP